MQSVLSPIIGRLSDVVDRKYLAAVPPVIAFVGAVVSAKATSMTMLIGGGILIGTTLSTIAIVQAIPAEVLPLKYRALANGFAFLAGAIGGLYVTLGLRKPATNSWQTWCTWSRRRNQYERLRMARHFLDPGCFPSRNHTGPSILLFPATKI